MFIRFSIKRKVKTGEKNAQLNGFEFFHNLTVPIIHWHE